MRTRKALVDRATSPLRVVLVSHSARMGGAEVVLLELAEALVGIHAIDVEVILPSHGPLEQALTAAGARHVVIPHYGWATLGRKRWAGPLLLLANRVAARRIAARLRRSRPDVVATNSVVIPAGAYAARRTGTPHLWLVHEYGDADHDYRFTHGVERTLREVGRLSRRVLTCSRDLARRVAEHIPAEKVLVVRYAITYGLASPTVPPPGRSGAPRVLLLGRKHPGKGQEEAIRAIARLRDRGSDATLHLVGEESQPYGRRLEALRERLHLRDRVEMVPWSDDPIAEIDRCDILLLCSRREAFGRVVVEGMKRDRPVIATRAGGAAEIIDDSGGGLLYPPGDDAALAAAIERLGRDPGEARRLAAAGRTWAEEHCTLEGYAGAFLDAARSAVATENG